MLNDHKNSVCMIWDDCDGRNPILEDELNKVLEDDGDPELEDEEPMKGWDERFITVDSDDED
jgi:hypothetical protein